jgi:hypothetical protein
MQLELALFYDASWTCRKSPQTNAGAPRPKERKTKMAWIVGSVQNVTLDDSLPTRPGFVIQEEEGSPILTLVFEDQKIC